MSTMSAFIAAVFALTWARLGTRLVSRIFFTSSYALIVLPKGCGDLTPEALGATFSKAFAGISVGLCILSFVLEPHKAYLPLSNDKGVHGLLLFNLVRMLTPEEKRLQLIGRSCELPVGATSLHLHRVDGQFFLDSYDEAGYINSTHRLDQMPKPLRDRIVELLTSEQCSDPDDGIACLL
jgi:hypothetical protein